MASQRLTFVNLSAERVHRCFCDYLFVNFHTGKLLQLVGEAGALEHGHVSQSLDLSEERRFWRGVDQLVDGQGVLLVGLGERVGQPLLQELEQQQCEEADEEVGADAVLPGVVDGPDLEVGLGGRLAADAHRLLDVSPRALLCSAECRLHIDNPLK